MTSHRASLLRRAAAVLALTAGLAGCGNDGAADGAADGPADGAGDVAEQRLRPWHEVGSLLPEELSGWLLADVHGYGAREGEYEVNNSELESPGSGGNPAEVTVTWRPSDQYQEYLDDRRDVSRPEQVQVAGFPAKLFTYSDDDFTALLRMEAEEVFIELRGSYLTRDEFKAFLGSLHAASEADFDRALVDAGLTLDDEGNS